MPFRGSYRFLTPATAGRCAATKKITKRLRSFGPGQVSVGRQSRSTGALSKTACAPPSTGEYTGTDSRSSGRVNPEIAGPTRSACVPGHRSGRRWRSNAMDGIKLRFCFRYRPNFSCVPPLMHLCLDASSSDLCSAGTEQGNATVHRYVQQKMLLRVLQVPRPSSSLLRPNVFPEAAIISLSTMTTSLGFTAAPDQHWRCFARQRLALAGILLLLVFLACAVLAPHLAPHDIQMQLDLATRLTPPSSTHWFGTDELGRDVLSRTLYGARVSLTVAFAVVAISLITGLVLGMLAGFYGGWLDTVINLYLA